MPPKKYNIVISDLYHYYSSADRGVGFFNLEHWYHLLIASVSLLQLLLYYFFSVIQYSTNINSCISFVLLAQIYDIHFLFLSFIDNF